MRAEKNEIGDKRIVQETNNTHKNCLKKGISSSNRKKAYRRQRLLCAKTEKLFPGK